MKTRDTLFRRPSGTGKFLERLKSGRNKVIIRSDPEIYEVYGRRSNKRNRVWRNDPAFGERQDRLTSQKDIDFLHQDSENFDLWLLLQPENFDF